MNGDEHLNFKNSAFWGAVAAFFWWLRERSKNSVKPEPEAKEMKMSEEQKGIKETKEVLEATKLISLFIIAKVKDGVQIQDGIDFATALFLNPEFKDKINAAADKINEVPAELQDLNLIEALELAKFGMDAVPEYINALKK